MTDNIFYSLTVVDHLPFNSSCVCLSPCQEGVRWQLMATSGVEDLGNGAVRPALIVQAKSVVVHSPNARGPPNSERKRLQGGAGDSLSHPHVRVLYDRPSCVSGIPSQRAYPHVPTLSSASGVKVSRLQSTSAYSLNGASKDLSKHSLLSKSLPHINSARTACHSHRQRHWNLDSFRLKSGLLGKRAFSPQRSVCPACPSPPKSISQRASVVVEKSMPTNQSLPWSSSKLRDNNNGVVRPPNAKMPSYSKQETADLHSSAAIVSGCNGTYLRGLKAIATRPAQPTVPLKDTLADVLLNQCKAANENVEEHARGSEHGTCEAPQRVSGISSEAEFTAAVQNLSRNNVHARHGTLNGLKPLSRLNGDCTVPIYLRNEDKDSCVVPMETNNFDQIDNSPSTVLCDGKIQGNDCAIPEVVDHDMTSPQSPSVYTVTNQISAIHLTKEERSREDPNLCQRHLEVERELEPEVQRCVNTLKGLFTVQKRYQKSP